MAALEAKCETLCRPGEPSGWARHEPDGINFGHLVMQDPEGNEFCVD